MPSLPSEEITQLMRFIAEKARNVTSPMNVTELCRQFKAEKKSLATIDSLKHRIERYRLKIHEMNEFDMKTKVKMMFAISAPIDTGFLEELKKVAEVEVDDKQRIIQYKQKEEGLELSGKHLRLSINQAEQRDREIIQFIAEKSKIVDTPIADKVLLREFKEKTGYTDSIDSLKHRYLRMKNTIYQSSEIDKNTRIKMLFISHARLSDETLEELRKDADVEVDMEGKITKYKANDGKLNLEGNHGRSSIWKSVNSYYYRKANENESEEEDDEDTNCQKDNEKVHIDLVRFLIERTENATTPLSITKLVKDFVLKFKNSDSVPTTDKRIRSFRERIHTINQCDTQTKVKLAFALSAPIDADFLKELQRDAIVELDKQQRIKKYNANDFSLNLEGDHSVSVKIRSGHAERMKRKASVLNDLSHSKNSEFAISKSPAVVLELRKRARQVSEEEDDEESLKVEDDWSMDFDTNKADDFDYDPSKYELDMDHIPIEKKPESLMEVKTEESSTAIVGNHYENFLEYDKLDYVRIPEEKKPECFTEVKLEVPEEPSTSNIEYHYEENSEQILIEPKPEMDDFQ